jgi:hypothetical protein
VDEGSSEKLQLLRMKRKSIGTMVLINGMATPDNSFTVLGNKKTAAIS